MWLKTVILACLAVSIRGSAYDYTSCDADDALRPGYPTFAPDPDGTANKLPKVFDANAFIYPGQAGTYKYRNNNYQRLMISVNGYIALLDDFDQPMPPIWPYKYDVQNRDMINLFYAGTDITGCAESEVTWRISDSQDDKDIFSQVIYDAEYGIEDVWEPDYMVIVTYDQVDMEWAPCCWGAYYYSYDYYYYDDKRELVNAKEAARGKREQLSEKYVTKRDNKEDQEKARKEESGQGSNARRSLKELHEEARCYECFTSHSKNSYQMALATKAVNDTHSETYVIFDYGHIGWIDYEPWWTTSWSQAGFTQKQRGSKYQFFGSFNWGMFELPDNGWPYRGVYAFRLDTWAPKCEPSWFIEDYNHASTGFWYDNPSCPLE